MDLLTIVIIVSVCIVIALPFAHEYVRFKAHSKGYTEGHVDCRRVLGQEIFRLSQEVVQMRLTLERRKD